METIDRYFRPGFWRLSVPLLIATILMVIATALVSTVLEEANPRAANAIGTLFGGYVLAAAALYAVLIFTRLRLHSDGCTLEASFMCLGFPVYRRSVDGRSWHAIARPGRPQMEGEGIGSYRVEVTTNEGGRIPFLGPILCWLFRIECL
jgi:hypothetical protein